MKLHDWANCCRLPGALLHPSHLLRSVRRGTHMKLATITAINEKPPPSPASRSLRLVVSLAFHLSTIKHCGVTVLAIHTCGKVPHTKLHIKLEAVVRRVQAEQPLGASHDKPPTARPPKPS